MANMLPRSDLRPCHSILVGSDISPLQTKRHLIYSVPYHHREFALYNTTSVPAQRLPIPSKCQHSALWHFHVVINCFQPCQPFPKTFPPFPLSWTKHFSSPLLESRNRKFAFFNFCDSCPISFTQSNVLLLLSSPHTLPHPLLLASVVLLTVTL